MPLADHLAGGPAGVVCGGGPCSRVYDEGGGEAGVARLVLAHAGRACEDAEVTGGGREDPQGLDGAGRGLLGRAELAGACERGLAVGALQPNAAAHAGDGVDDQADSSHAASTPGSSPPVLCGFHGRLARCLFARRRRS